VCVRGRGGVEKVNCENLKPCQSKILIEMAFCARRGGERLRIQDAVANSESLVCPLTDPSRAPPKAFSGSDSPF
jgi:hypothetical protein